MEEILVCQLGIEQRRKGKYITANHTAVKSHQHFFCGITFSHIHILCTHRVVCRRGESRTLWPFRGRKEAIMPSAFTWPRWIISPSSTTTIVDRVARNATRFSQQQKGESSPALSGKGSWAPKGTPGRRCGPFFSFFFEEIQACVYDNSSSTEHYRTDSDGQKVLKLPYGSSEKEGEWHNR